MREIVKTCADVGIKNLTLYAFSTENWLRPKQGVSQLMRLLSFALQRETLDLDKNNVRLRALGRIEELPKSVGRELQDAVKRLDKNTGLCLNLA